MDRKFWQGHSRFCCKINPLTFPCRPLAEMPEGNKSPVKLEFDRRFKLE